MTTTGANTFFARPVFLSEGTEHFQHHSSSANGPRGAVKKHTRFASEVETFDPPPRPPPPRPSRAPKQTEGMSGGRVQHRQLPPTPQENLEAKPLTKLNVTSHDKLWQKDFDDDENTGPSGILSPPLKYITLERTEEMLRNFDPNDITDSISDRSDSSADTMIMMTTEEERRNQEKINRNLKQFTSVKTKQDRQSTNKTKGNLQTKKNLHIKFSDTNGIDGEWKRVPNGPMETGDQMYSKVEPLHIRTDNDGHMSSPESASIKSNGNHRSPSDSPDDGYGTNSSSGTVSSPFSSSFGSNDLENSYTRNMRKLTLPNGAIKPNSVRESWAVKRKQRMIDAQDNSVQEQLRHLTVIEEEGRSKGIHKKNLNTPNLEQNKPNEKPAQKNGLAYASRPDNVDDQAFVNVSQNDLHKINRQLYVISSERDAIQGNRRYSERSLPKTPVTNEINSGLQGKYTDNVSNSLPRSRNSDDVFTSPAVNCVNRTNEHAGNQYSWEDESDVGGPDSGNSGPLLLRGGSEQRYRTASGSGKIYVSPSGDEGFYSLNRSSRSTSLSSFQPINEVNEAMPETDTSESQRSPLETLSGDLLEKWSDMDRNYRNYYGFDENAEKYSRTDSKIYYFQEKKINAMYGQDNYYRPPNYGPKTLLIHTKPDQVHGQSSNQGSAGQIPSQDSRNKNGGVESEKQLPKSQKKSGKEKESSKSKLFQILPSMFKPSSKKQASDPKEAKSGKGKQPLTIEPVQRQEATNSLPEHDEEAEYINMGDLPQYSIAQVEYEEKLRKGQFVSLENLHKRPVFASSRDIKKLFSTHDQSFDSIHSPGAQRHSFHAMPLSYRHNVSTRPAGGEEEMRPRAQSTSATMRSLQLQNSVESRKALIARKNAAVMSQARQVQVDENKAGNISFNSNQSSNQRSSRSRLNSGDSSGGDSKLSTLV